MILLVAYGYRSYGAYASNLALSIKHYNPSIQIQLVCDKFNFHSIDRSLFCTITVKPDDYFVDPCKVKLQLDQLTVFSKTLYLDVDAIATQDIAPLLNYLSSLKDPVFIPALGAGYIGDEVKGAHWCDSWKWLHWYDLEENYNPCYYGLQTSLIYWDNSERSRIYWAYVKHLYSNTARIPKQTLKNTWGQSKQYPDELFATIAFYALQFKIDVNLQPVFFPDEEKADKEIISKYYLLSQFGNVNVLPYAFKLYDSILRKIEYITGRRGSSVKAQELYFKKFTRSTGRVYE